MNSDKRLFDISIYDMEGNYVTTVFGVKVASELTGATRPNISSCLSCYNTHANGFQFRKAKGNPMINIGDVSNIQGSPKKRPVSKWFEDNLITVYKSIALASKKNGIPTGSIHESCDKGYKAGIYNFKYV